MNQVICPWAAHARPSVRPVPDWNFVQTRLLRSGFTPEFIESLKLNYDPTPFSEVLELNTLLFLRKSDYHGIQVNDEAVEKVRNFIKLNQDALAHARMEYGVPGEVVASLLWIESRHGSNQGRFHVPSVFVDLVQADRPAVILYLFKAAKRFTKRVTGKNRRDITARAKKRVTWALNELKALATMQKANGDVLTDLKGSFAGAFGIAQFEPSSYVPYARAQSSERSPNLDRADDAIQSVAYYLYKSGWHEERKKSQVRALMRYNNSHDYAAAILKLARQATSDSSRRVPAGQ